MSASPYLDQLCLEKFSILYGLNLKREELLGGIDCLHPTDAGVWQVG